MGYVGLKLGFAVPRVDVAKWRCNSDVWLHGLVSSRPRDMSPLGILAGRSSSWERSTYGNFYLLEISPGYEYILSVGLVGEDEVPQLKSFRVLVGNQQGITSADHGITL